MIKIFLKTVNDSNVKVILSKEIKGIHCIFSINFLCFDHLYQHQNVVYCTFNFSFGLS